MHLLHFCGASCAPGRAACADLWLKVASAACCEGVEAMPRCMYHFSYACAAVAPLYALCMPARLALHAHVQACA